MKPLENQGVSYIHLSAQPDQQRAAIAAARKSGEFNGRAHLAASPVGRAVAAGFPLPKR